MSYKFNMLTAGELRAALAHIPDDRPICLCIDDAGDGLYHFQSSGDEGDKLMLSHYPDEENPRVTAIWSGGGLLPEEETAMFSEEK